MDIYTTLKMALVLSMWCLGLFQFTFAAQRLRFFYPVNKSISTESKAGALEACKMKNASSVTLYDEQDAKFAFSFTKEVDVTGGTRKVWLGLQYVGNWSNWTDGEPVTFTSNYTVHLGDGEQTCVAIENGNWQNFTCSDKKFFMCSKGDNYTLLKSDRTWCQALQHCRRMHSELVSIHNETQNKRVEELGKDSSFWIGLRYDHWKWDDNGCSSFRKWKEFENAARDRKWTGIGITDRSVELYKRQATEYGFYSFCAKGNVSIKVINESLTWEEAFDYCKENHSRLLWITDRDDQKAVEQWLDNYDVEGQLWIGLLQSRVFGFWIWAGGTTVWYSNWRDDKIPEMPMSHHCGVIDKSDKKWNDGNCLLKRPFLCEEDIIYMS